MEQFLRNYYTNLNPNATEEDILAFLASQGFGGMGDFTNQGSTGTGGITDLRQQMFQRQQQDFRMDQDDGGISNLPGNLPVGSKPPGVGMTALAYLINPFLGMAMSGQRLADRGKLPGGLNKLFASRSSGDVEIDLPTTPTGYGGFGSAQSASDAAKEFGGRDYSSSPGAIAGDMEYDEE